MSYILEDMGSYTVGGRLHEVTDGSPYQVNFTRSVAYEVDPRGHFAVEHAYVQYFVPKNRRPGPPVLLVHGGGMSGSCWETTPDGRPGWLQLLLQRGYEVHVLDSVERGRAGFAPGLWDGAPILRSLEEAWALFRIGPSENFDARQVYPGQLFPVASFEKFAQCFVPRWLGTSPLQVAALCKVLQRIGPAIVICHSQGGELAFDAHRQCPELFAAVIAIEPSGLPETSEVLAETPSVFCLGDFLDTAEHWQRRTLEWLRFSSALQSLGAPHALLKSGQDFARGNSHMLMMDSNSEAVLDRAFDALRGLL